MDQESLEMDQKMKDNESQKSRDLDTERKEFERMMNRQSEASKSYLSGKFRTS